MTAQSLSDPHSEFDALLNEYHQRFPDAVSPATYMMSFGPEQLCTILRKANGQEIVFSYPDQDQGVLDGCIYYYKEAPGIALTLQELLHHRRLPRHSRVKLVRHRDTTGGVDVYALYRDEPEKFLAYQRRQKKEVFKNCEYLVSFLGEDGRRARFVGVYAVGPVEAMGQDALDYTLTEMRGYEDLKERVIIDWGKGNERNWHMMMRDTAPKTVLEIQARPFSLPFTDYLDFTITFAQLRTLVKSQSPRDEWCRMLSAVAGIYLILDKSSGKQYIGSASGTEGIWGRWREYVTSAGTGGNVELVKLMEADPSHARHFQFTVLMTLPKTMTRLEVERREYLFMKKLGSRAYGLNQKASHEQ
ncbi:hypothetical protein GCM10028824_43490 [Hymenobacter segetis]|uniref:GIY-YIG nuclease family protein n=1 Tax=Hymenobacter segetis TaxID=2025509 RepID=A0ABU9LWW4_9BACT